MSDSIKSGIAAYYDSCLKAHGDTPKGVDWKDLDSQVVRLERIIRHLTEPLKERDSLSVLDVGCGTGALFGLLNERFGKKVRYTGIDIAPSMIESAKAKFSASSGAAFQVGSIDEAVGKHDFVVASGIFNVKQGIDTAEWRKHVLQTIKAMFERSAIGIVFNCLSSQCDFRNDKLFYSDPAEMIAYCEKHLSRHFTLDQSYGFFEYTLAVYKQPQRGSHGKLK